jgi:hypothetical protein
VDKTESYSLAAFTVVIGMSIGLMCVLLIPIDIFLTTSDDAKFAEIIKIDKNYLGQIMMSIKTF